MWPQAEWKSVTTGSSENLRRRKKSSSRGINGHTSLRGGRELKAYPRTARACTPLSALRAGPVSGRTEGALGHGEIEPRAHPSRRRDLQGRLLHRLGEPGLERAGVEPLDVAVAVEA